MTKLILSLLGLFLVQAAILVAGFHALNNLVVRHLFVYAPSLIRWPAGMHFGCSVILLNKLSLPVHAFFSEQTEFLSHPLGTIGSEGTTLH